MPSALGSGGRDYRVFRERLARLENLAVRVQIESADEFATLRFHLKGSFPHLLSVPS